MAHTRQAFDSELKNLEQELLEMGSFVEQMISAAVEALVKLSPEIAMEVIVRDDIVDRMDLDIEQRCLRLLALQQPMARDLRIIGTAMKMVIDIERVGDHSVDIAKAAMKLSKEPQSQLLVDVPRLAALARAMLRDSLEAFVKRDMNLVLSVCERDNEVDTLYRELRDQLHETMKKDSSLVIQASWQLLVINYIERVADHATNIAERVGYMQTGKLEHVTREAMEEYSTEPALHSPSE